MVLLITLIPVSLFSNGKILTKGEDKLPLRWHHDKKNISVFFSNFLHVDIKQCTSKWISLKKAWDHCYQITSPPAFWHWPNQSQHSIIAPTTHSVLTSLKKLTCPPVSWHYPASPTPACRPARASGRRGRSPDSAGHPHVRRHCHPCGSGIRPRHRVPSDRHTGSCPWPRAACREGEGHCAVRGKSGQAHRQLPRISFLLGFQSLF